MCFVVRLLRACDFDSVVCVELRVVVFFGRRVGTTLATKQKVCPCLCPPARTTETRPHQSRLERREVLRSPIATHMLTLHFQCRTITSRMIADFSAEPCDPRTGGQSGPLAVQSPLTGYHLGENDCHLCGRKDELFKLQNFGWTVLRATVTLFILFSCFFCPAAKIQKVYKKCKN